MSLMKEGNLKTRGLRILLTYSEMRSVGWPLAETIGEILALLYNIPGEPEKSSHF